LINQTNMDEDDSEKNQQIKKQKPSSNFLQRYLINVSDVLSPIWVRRVIQIDNGREWFILGSRCHFLFNFRMFLVILYLSYETFK
jgi:hypothetical protein